MLKKIILAVLICLPSFAFAQKIGVVDTQSIIVAMPETKDMQATLEAAQKKYETELKNLDDKLQKEMADVKSLPADTPQSILERRYEDIEQLQQFYQTAQQDIAQQQQRLLAPIQERLRTAISTVGAEGSYTLILEKQEPLYIGTDATDLTSQVRAKLGM